jgi:hypothetical protein
MYLEVRKKGRSDIVDTEDAFAASFKPGCHGHHHPTMKAPSP